MERYILVGVIAASLLAIVVALFIPGGRAPDQFPKLPWKITLEPDGKVRVLGLVIGHTTLAEAQDILSADAKINLFASNDGKYAVEAYFERLFLSGIKADLILTLDATQEETEQMFQRGLRISKLGSGSRKVNLATEDTNTILQRPIKHITYVPAADLEEAIIIARFGDPEAKIAEDNGVRHWLYPDKGLDIALNPDGKEVFQYVQPSEFERLTTPLRQSLNLTSTSE